VYKFLWSGKWMGYLLMAAIFAAACIGLGMWQMGRKAETDTTIHRIERNYSATPLTFAAARNDFAKLDPADEWSPVTLIGTYDVANQRVVRNRTFNGQPGYEVVVPLRLEGGDTVVVDRGWLPIGNNDPGHPDTIPEPVAGQVTVVARLRPAEPALNRGAPAGQLASIDLTAYQQQLGYPMLTGSYGQLVSESPAAAVNPQGFVPPTQDDGTHLSYMLQWFAFGVLFFVGYGYAARQQARAQVWAAQEAENSGEDPEDALGYGSHFRPSPPPRPRSNRKRPTAEEEEDAVLDAQGF
jgi:cytochrome oxidase assembly protein ShyY1